MSSAAAGTVNNEEAKNDALIYSVSYESFSAVILQFDSDENPERNTNEPFNSLSRNYGNPVFQQHHHSTTSKSRSNSHQATKFNRRMTPDQLRQKRLHTKCKICSNFIHLADAHESDRTTITIM